MDTTVEQFLVSDVAFPRGGLQLLNLFIEINEHIFTHRRHLRISSEQRIKLKPKVFSVSVCVMVATTR